MMKRLLLLLACLCLLAVPALGESGYPVYIDDEADLLTDEEEARLIEDMRPLSRYGTVAFYSIAEGFGSVDAKTNQYINDHISADDSFSCAVLLIDMQQRELCFRARGEIYRYVGIGDMYTITGNVSARATGGKYYDCAAEAYWQMLSLLLDYRVPSIVSILCSAVLAAALALLIAYHIVTKDMFVVKEREATTDYMNVTFNTTGLAFTSERLVRSTKKYIPRNNSDFGGGGGGGGSGGGGGGGGSGSSSF